MNRLDNIIESIMYLCSNGLSISDLEEKLNVNISEINESINRLKKKYSGDSGIIIKEYNGIIQFATNPEYKNEVMSVVNPIREKELSNQMLEALSVIAYKQPITKLELDEIRGHDSDYALSLLLNNDLIEIVGRKDAIGKPFLYGTTDLFLRRFQLESLKDLPNYETLLSQIKVINTSTDLYDIKHRIEENHEN